jgi:hypothetical protein
MMRIILRCFTEAGLPNPDAYGARRVAASRHRAPTGRRMARKWSGPLGHASPSSAGQAPAHCATCTCVIRGLLPQEIHRIGAIETRAQPRRYVTAAAQDLHLAAQSHKAWSQPDPGHAFNDLTH